MLEYDTICYLQNQKTGSSFVEAFLRAHLTEELRLYNQHKPPNVKKKGKFYFTNVREPLDLYISLFNYGLDGYGRVLMRSRRLGHGAYYDQGIDGFDRWLAFLLSPEFAPVIPKYTAMADRFGLATWRFQRLSHFNFRRETAALDYVARAETLRDDLKTLASTHLAHALRDVPAALEWIEDYRAVNPSRRRDRAAGLSLSPATIAALIERDGYLYENFYPARLRQLGAAITSATDSRPIALADLGSG